MRTITQEIKLFKFNELSSTAKEKVKEWYLSTLNPEDFQEDCKNYLDSQFGIKDGIKVLFNLGYCQGDGLCMVGEIHLYDMDEKLFKLLTKGFTKRQKEIISQEVSKIIFNKVNHHYQHANTVNIEINIDEDQNPKHTQIFDKFITRVKAWYFEQCSILETSGYDYFYEVSEECLQDFCESNQYEFTENGELY